MTGINNIATEQYDIIPAYREIVRNLTTWYKQCDRRGPEPAAGGW